MACHIRCPFCKSSPAVGYYYKHLISQHLIQLFDEETDWGRNNRRWLNATQERRHYSLYLPKSENKYCCPSCKVAFNKIHYADKHIVCAKKNLEKCAELRQLVNLTPKTAPFPELAESHTPALVLPNDKEIYYCKLIKALANQITSMTEENYWYNKIVLTTEGDKVLRDTQEKEGVMPEDEEFSMDTLYYRELKGLNMKYADIQEMAKKRPG